MAAKKKSKKKNSAKKVRTTNRVQTKKASAKKVRTAKASPKKSAKKKSVKKKNSPRKVAVKRAGASGSPSAKRQTLDSSFSELRRRGSRPVPALSGDADSQGLSDTERADSESVSELLEEGNTFEAGIVRGVEKAEDDDERGVREVRMREFPEDDVPEEYLDQDE
jgi:hypothetical protein